MGSRFEKTIAAGVMAGAIALAGCGGGGGDGGGEDDTTAPAFLGGRTISPTKIELKFSEPVQIGGGTGAARFGDASAVAGLFSLKGNEQSFGVAYSTSVPAGVNIVDHYTFFGEGTWKYSAWYSFASVNSAPTTSTGEAGLVPIPSVTTISANDDKVILTLAGSIPELADRGTGMLRLKYTEDASGIQDAAGNLLPDITLGKLDRGNVVDTVSSASEGPKLIDARTIDSTTVALTFNEAVEIVSKADAMDSFNITSNYFRYSYFASVGVGFFAHSTSDSGAGWMACNNGFSWDFTSVTGSLNVSCNYGSASPAISNVAVSADVPETLLIRLAAPIPANADHGTGRLKLFFQPQSDPITDTQGNPVLQFGFGPLHWGNVKDTIGN